MRWNRRTTVIWAGSAAFAVIAAVAAYLLLSPPSPARPRPAKIHPVAAPRPVRRPLLSPFTGEPVKRLGPVLAVKIDNIIFARPQTGLTHADIVYVLPVEGGLSRFLTIFSSHFPPVIGPVRSARQDDLALLRQFGRPAFAYSGAAPGLLPFVEHAHVVDLYAGISGGYYRGQTRIAPYNLYAHTRQLLAEAHGASKAHHIGFIFGPPPPGGQAVRSFTARYPAASFEFRWSAPRGRWLVWMDGARAMTTDDGQLRPATVVVQYTTVTTSPFLEYGSRPPYAKTTGSGRAVVLRGGKAYDVHWSRPRRRGGTRYTLASGQRMPFARGQVWIVLVSRR